LFTDAGNEKQTYYYAVRAVSTGVFMQGPVSADAMYDGAIHSYHGAGVIKVLPR
jgi:alpha-2-macroglobulin